MSATAALVLPLLVKGTCQAWMWVREKRRTRALTAFYRVQKVWPPRSDVVNILHIGAGRADKPIFADYLDYSAANCAYFVDADLSKLPDLHRNYLRDDSFHDIPDHSIDLIVLNGCVCGDIGKIAFKHLVRILRERTGHVLLYNLCPDHRVPHDEMSGLEECMFDPNASRAFLQRPEKLVLPKGTQLLRVQLSTVSGSN